MTADPLELPDLTLDQLEVSADNLDIGKAAGIYNAFVKWVPICPEVEIGMGTPRETIRLEGSVDDPPLIATKSGVDHTNAMKRWSKQRMKALDELDLHGFVLKRASPSCGAFRVKVHPENGGTPLNRGQGVFARALAQRCPPERRRVA